MGNTSVEIILLHLPSASLWIVVFGYSSAIKGEEMTAGRKHQLHHRLKLLLAQLSLGSLVQHECSLQAVRVVLSDTTIESTGGADQSVLRPILPNAPEALEKLACDQRSCAQATSTFLGAPAPQLLPTHSISSNGPDTSTSVWCSTEILLLQHPVKTAQGTLHTTARLIAVYIFSSSFLECKPTERAPRNRRAKHASSPRPLLESRGLQRPTGSSKPLGPSRTGGGNPGTQLAFRLSVDGGVTPEFGCLVVKCELHLHECVGKKAHWKEVRALCRSTHLEDHCAQEYLTAQQLAYIRFLANKTGQQTDDETWRDCFLHLYPDFAKWRAQLNPWAGQRLLAGVDDPLLWLEAQQQRQASQLVHALARRPTAHISLQPTPESLVVREQYLVTAQTDHGGTVSHMLRPGPAVFGDDDNRSLPALRVQFDSRLNSPNAPPDRWFQVRGSPIFGRDVGSRSGSRRLPSSRYEASEDSIDLSNIDPALHPPRHVTESFVTPGPATNTARDRRTTGTTPSMVTDNTVDTDQEEAPRFTAGGFPAPPPEDLVLNMGGDITIPGPDGLEDFQRDLEVLSRDPPMQYVNLAMLKRKAPGEPDWEPNRTRRGDGTL